MINSVKKSSSSPSPAPSTHPNQANSQISAVAQQQIRSSSSPSPKIAPLEIAFPLGKPIEDSAKDIEFQEFIRRVPRQEQMAVRFQWFTTQNIQEVASYLVRSASAALQSYQDPEFIELISHPNFDAFVLYAMSGKMTEDQKLGVEEASQLLLYSQAVKTFGADEVSIHTVDEEGKTDSDLEVLFGFFGGRAGMPKQLPEHHRIFFSVEWDVYDRKRSGEGIDERLERVNLVRELRVFSLDPVLLLPPAFLQGLADNSRLVSAKVKAKIRPVLGPSIPEDFKNFSVRDVLVPSTLSTPKLADGHTVPHPIAFYRHDVYHFLIDTFNLNLAEHQRVHEFFAAKAKEGENSAAHYCAEFSLDREFIYGALLKRDFEKMESRDEAAFKEVSFFLDLATIGDMMKKEDVNSLIALLPEAIPDDFSIDRAMAHPLYQKMVASDRFIAEFSKKLSAAMSK